MKVSVKKRNLAIISSLICALVTAALVLTGCATVEENIAKTKAEYYTPGEQIHLTDMNGEYRFCEVGLITGTTKANAVINIWNSTGSGDCPPEQFAALDADRYRNTQFKFNKGREVYLLDAPDGEVFVMQSYTDHFDKRVTKDNLANLGSIMKLPEGWKFRAVVLDRELIVNQKRANNLAHVLQDNIRNTYQGSDGGKAFNYVP